jgi:hypothetical protein
MSSDKILPGALAGRARASGIPPGSSGENELIILRAVNGGAEPPGRPLAGCKASRLPRDWQTLDEFDRILQVDQPPVNLK